MPLITKLEPNEVFVFGSNLAGRHGKGAALTAYKKFGAIYGQGVGLMGQSYAIPTKDHYMHILPLTDICYFINHFLIFAATKPELKFLVTEIGCGLAGYTPKEIAPCFGLGVPNNVILPDSFIG